MHSDTSMPIITGTIFIIIFLAVILRKFKQPFVVIYMIAGVLLGPSFLNLFPDIEGFNRVGSFGVLFLLFFIGMEVSLPSMVKNWRVVVIGTILQISISVLCIYGLGQFLGWPINRSILLGFVISLSSTAVILKLLEEWDESESPVGQKVIGILLVQDILIIPMLISINLLGGMQLDFKEVILQIIGALLMLALLVFIIVKKEFSMPFSKSLKKDHELQLFLSMFLCFGLAFVTGLFGLSTALGAFIAGLVVAATKEIDWVQTNLEPFRGLFVALFFTSIGLSINFNFLVEKWLVILVLAVAALVTNTLLNATILKFLKVETKEALYAGALLSQIGEFSFVLAALGLQRNIISDYGYQATVGTIFITLLMSHFWISLAKKVLLKGASLSPTQPSV